MGETISVSTEIAPMTGAVDPQSGPQTGDGAQGSAPSSSQAPQPSPAGDRPSWLPEKFKSAEDLAAAYKALETKLGTPAKVEPAKTPADALKIEKPAEAPAGLDLGEFHKEFAETGGLGEESYGKLAKLGFDKATVDTYIAGVSALTEQQTQQVYAIAGGQAQLEQINTWAAENLTAEELETYNRAVTSGKASEMTFALKGLVARYRAENGVEPTLMTGKGTASKATGFRSAAEMKAAMADPRYETDEAYRSDVADRVKNRAF